MRMLVLGAGLQGTACSYDLLKNPAVTRVLLADVRVGALPAFLTPDFSADHTSTRCLAAPRRVQACACGWLQQF